MKQTRTTPRHRRVTARRSRNAFAALLMGTFVASYATAGAANIDVNPGDTPASITLVDGDILTNEGTIGSTNHLSEFAVEVQAGAAVSIFNNSDIDQLYNNGVLAKTGSDVSFVNSSGGVIISQTGITLHEVASFALTNYGEVISDNGFNSIFSMDSDNLSIINLGLIRVMNSAASGDANILYLNADTVFISNEATMDGGYNGITGTARTGNIVNGGLIEGNGGYAIDVEHSEYVSLWNDSTGILDGDVFLEAPDVAITLRAGGSITGDLTSIGERITLELDGAPADSDSLSGVVGGTINLQASQNLSLLVTDSNWEIDQVLDFDNVNLYGGNVLVSTNNAFQTADVVLSGSNLFLDADTYTQSFLWDSGDLTIIDNGSLVVYNDFLMTAGTKTLKLDFDPNNYQTVYTLIEAYTQDLSAIDLSQFDFGFAGLAIGSTLEYELIAYPYVLGVVIYERADGPLLQNSGPVNTNPDAFFVINGYAQTGDAGDNNSIRGLVFENNGELEIHNTLDITEDIVIVRQGTGVISGDQLDATHLVKFGQGKLVLDVDQINVNFLFANFNGETVLNSSLTSSATENYGDLIINGDLTTNNLYNAPDAWLGGSGVIRGDVSNLGFVNPGNSPGTLTIVGNYTQAPTGALIVEVESSSNHDRLHVSGTATLAGDLIFGGDIDYGDKVRFLRAGNIVGAFDDIYTPDGIRVRLFSKSTSITALFAPEKYSDLATTANHRSVAKALDRFISATSGDRETVSIALDHLKADEYANAFQQVSPALHETIGTQAVNLTQQQGRLLQQRVGTARYGIRGSFQSNTTSSALQTDRDGKSVAQSKAVKEVVTTVDEPNRWSAWVEGNGIFSRVTQAHQVPNGRTRSGGFTVGSDYAWNPNFITGLFAGYQGLETKYTDESRATMNGARFGGYGTYTLDNGLYFDGIAWGGVSEYDVHRRIKFGSIDRTANSTQKAGEVSAILGTGYDWKPGNFIVGPTASLQYTYVGIDGFTEHDAKSLNLDIDRQRIHSLRSNLGARLAYRHEINENAIIVPELRASWEYEFLNDARNIDGQLSGKNITYRTQAGERSSLFAGAGINALFNNRVSTSVFYNVDLGRSNDTAHIISASFGVQW